MAQQILDYSRLELRGDAGMFFEKRIEYDGNNNPIYIGYNRHQNTATDDESWFIVKITYSGNNPTYYQLPANGPQFVYSWDDRATYF